MQKQHTKKYREYIKSDAWLQMKIWNFGFGRKCVACSASKELHKHHLTYERLFRERDDDLCYLCKRCHFLHHLFMKTDKTYAKNYYRKKKGYRQTRKRMKYMIKVLKRYFRKGTIWKAKQATKEAERIRSLHKELDDEFYSIVSYSAVI